MKVKNIMFFGFAAAILSAGAANAALTHPTTTNYGNDIVPGTNDRKIVTSKAYVDANTNKLAQDIRAINIPTDTGDLTNNAGFITSADVPEALSDLTDDIDAANKLNAVKVNGVAQTITDKTVDITVPTNNNQLTNGAGYITNADLPTALSDLTDDISAANVLESVKVNGVAQTITDKTVDITVPTNNNQLTNGAGYITSAAIPTNVSSFTNDSGYLTESDLTDDFSGKANVSLNNIDAAGQTVIDNRVVAKAAEGTYSNATSGLAATNIQAAIDEIAGDVSDLDGERIVHDGDNVSVLSNDAGYITSADVKDGTLTITGTKAGTISTAYTANSASGATININDVPEKPAECTNTNPCALVTDDTGNWIWLAMAQPGA